jgi:hypothetical protein
VKSHNYNADNMAKRLLSSISGKENQPGSKIKRITSGWNEFYADTVRISRSNMTGSLAENSHMSECQKAGQMWKELDDSAKQVYRDRAAASSAARASSSLQLLTTQTSRRDSTCSSLRPRQKSRVQRITVVNSARALQSHPLWSSGLNLSSYQHSLRPDFIDPKVKDTVINMTLKTLVGCTSTAAPNPNEKVKHRRVCWLTHGGLCCKDIY